MAKSLREDPIEAVGVISPRLARALLELSERQRAMFRDLGWKLAERTDDAICNGESTEPEPPRGLRFL